MNCCVILCAVRITTQLYICSSFDMIRYSDRYSDVIILTFSLSLNNINNPHINIYYTVIIFNNNRCAYLLFCKL